MAYDEALAHRVRQQLGDDIELVEKKMFGGVAFMLNGNMAVGISKDELMVRIPAEEHDALTAQSGVRDFDMAGRPMKGWILVGPGQLVADDHLAYWIDLGLDFAASLPPK